MDELVAFLAGQRQLLEMLLFRLMEVRHLLAAGETRFLPWAATEVERAVHAVRERELARAALFVGLGEDRRLASLADASPEPHRTVLCDHRAALRALLDEVGEVARANGVVASHRLDAEAYPAVSGARAAVAGGSRWGTTGEDDVSLAALDEQQARSAYLAALLAAADLRLPSLLDFLG